MNESSRIIISTFVLNSYHNDTAKRKDVHLEEY